MSPQADYLAVLTSHTVHICLLPDASHLTTEDKSPLKPRFFTLGPTSHVTSKSPVASALWHPLGVHGAALVTVTKDAVVRLWEISPTNRWSFDSASLTIDLKKLADGTWLDQDFSASARTTNKSFSPDSFDMEVAAACFGSRSSGGWSSMTLWIAMRGGDVYALCPLLPQRWAPPPTLIPSLSVSIVAKVAALEDDAGASPQAKRLAQQQLEWMGDLDNQEPKVVETSMSEPLVEIYNRPAHPGVVPRLQGPFEIELDPESEFDQDNELCDILAIGEKSDTTDLMGSEDEELEDEADGLSLSVICLLSTSGKLRVCLDLQGVVAQWLPSKTSKPAPLLRDGEMPSLWTFQCVDVLRERERRQDSWSVFSPDIASRYSFYITHPFGISFISLAAWVFRLEQELQSESKDGTTFRIDLLVKGKSTSRERIYTHPQEGSLAACVAIRDPDLGYFLLSATPKGPVAVAFETPEDEYQPVLLPTPSPPFEVKQEEEEEAMNLDLDVSRPPFQEPEELNETSELGHAKEMLFSSRHQFMRNQEVRLSPATLEIFTNVHRLVGAESGRLNRAAAQLFTKLESLPAELHEQITKADLVKQRVEKISGQDVEHERPVGDQARLQKRLEAAQARQKQLAERMDRLKRTMNRATGRELSEKEKAYAQEVRAVEASIMRSEKDQASWTPKNRQLLKRLEEVKALKAELISQAGAILEKDGEAKEDEAPRMSVSGLKIPADVRKAKVAHVMSQLERETALVEAVKLRLERLALG